MINWLTENIGTAAYLKIIDTDLDKHIIIDVRDLVDKDGNYSDTILKKIEVPFKEYSGDLVKEIDDLISLK